MADLYRKSSLEKLSSPDRLDCMLVVASPMSIVAVAAAAVLCIAVIVWAFIGTIPEVVSGNGVAVGKYSLSTVFSPEGGTVTQVFVSSGDKISIGDPVLELQTLSGTTYTVNSDQNGTVFSLGLTAGSGENSGSYIEKGSYIAPFTEILHVIPDINGDLAAVCYIPISYAEKIKPGMSANIFMSSAVGGEHINATVTNVDRYAVSSTDVASVVGSEMSSIFTSDGPVAAVVCSMEDNEKFSLSGGEILSIQFVTEQNAPITKIFPFMKAK